MKELVLISGKGGTGKTSIAASFATLSDSVTIADCDVDAANLHLVLTPSPSASGSFAGGSVAVIDQSACSLCGRCLEVCRFDAVRRKAASRDGSRTPLSIDPMACEGCGACSIACPCDAIRLEDVETGRWFVSDTRAGPMVHADLAAGRENSGKLVTVVRSRAATVARARGTDLLLSDGPPGIGCPVIASITGADLALIVTEPTTAAAHDLERVLELTERLNVPAAVAVNRWDLNESAAEALDAWCSERSLPVLGRIPYDESITRAQMNCLTVTEYSNGPASKAIETLWHRTTSLLNT